MSQTHLALHYHLVFHTKDNIPFIDSEWRGRLHAFLGGCLTALGAIPIAIGGRSDHGHVLAGLRATHCLADVVKEIKVASSKWIHTEIGKPKFAWQGGYGAFTVSTSQLERVRQYVLNQEEHHRRRSAREEYIELLNLAGIVYDERFF